MDLILLILSHENHDMKVYGGWWEWTPTPHAISYKAMDSIYNINNSIHADAVILHIMELGSCMYYCKWASDIIFWCS